MRKEIEVKAKVDNLADLKDKLEALGCIFSEPLLQDDRIFAEDSAQYDQAQTGANFLRIRNSNGTIIFTVKQTQSNELDCIEHETEITDPEEMANALLLLGYKEVVHVRKMRLKTRYNDCEICLDELEGLGSFIEMEKITDSEDADKVQDELFDFLESIGVRREDRVINGYDTLIYQKTRS